MKLDTIDKQILAQLDINARASAAEIARQLHYPKETVNYRIKKLLNSNVIDRIYTLFNSSLMGYIYYKIYIKFSHLDPRSEKEIVDFIANHPRCANLRVLQGKYDLAFVTVHSSTTEIKLFLQKFYELFGRFVFDKDIHQIMKTYKFNQKFLIDLPSTVRSFVISEKEDIAIDAIDKQICRLLAADARMRLIDIAEKVGVDPRIIRYRIKKLEERGIIAGFTIDLNLEEIQRELVEVNFSLNDLTAVSPLLEFFDGTKTCIFANELLGRYDLSVELYVKDDAMLREILATMRQRFLQRYLYFDVNRVYHEQIIDWYPFPVEKEK